MSMVKVLSKNPIFSLMATCALLVSGPAAGEDASDKDAAGARRKGREHWAFQAIRNPPVPQVRDRDWVRNPIDAFILARLEKESVKPSAAARRATLLRRVYLDLIGLPPGPAEVDAFLSDKRADAYEQLVDRLLASPHYGERWGRHWLDMARYADSDGFEQDRVRPYAWRWREWVIDALNADLPFDQFSVEQLAGDLLPGASIDQRVATGFHRNTLINREGGIDGEEDRVKRTVDRTNTLGEVWLGMTVGCTQCHDHKYDPLAQSEYYGLYAFFNNLEEPDIPAPDPEEFKAYTLAKAEFDKEHAPYLERVSAYEKSKLPATIAAWDESIDEAVPTWVVLEPTKLASAQGSTLTRQEDASVFVTGENDRSDVYTFVAETELTSITAFRLEVIADERLPGNGPGRASNGNFVLTSFRVTAAPATPANAGSSIPAAAGPVGASAQPEAFALQHPHADFSQVNRPVAAAVGDDPTNGWAIHPRVGMPHAALFETRDDIGFEGGTRLRIELHHALHHDHNIGRFRISASTLRRPVRPDIVDVLRLPEEERSDKQRAVVTEFYRTLDPEFNALTAAAAEHAKEAPKNPGEKTKAQAVAERLEPRGTQVHIRGDFLHKGDEVEPHAPTILPPVVSRDECADRLDLARWLFTPEHPLTARVLVNRLWQQYFGRGIVATDNDFGTQGDPPSHPGLLDWLATRFREGGWSLKALHRLIVTSATYRQSSDGLLELVERDPLNTWLAHQNRLRVEAEVIRDLSLAASGLLCCKVGGPSVRPPQPAGVAELGFNDQVGWKTSTGADIYRRGVYTHFQRTVPYPMLLAFDAPNSNTSCTRRERSNTPLQALTLWNDPVFFDMAQALGRRIIEEAPRMADRQVQVTERIRYAFRLCLGRHPDAAEAASVRKFYASQLAQFETDEESAGAAIGDRPGPDGATAAELAAWVIVGRTILNMDEFITRE